MTYVNLRKILLIISLSSLSIVVAQNSYKCNVYECSHSNLAENQCIYPHVIANTTDQFYYDISLKCKLGTFCPAEYSQQNVTCRDRAPPSNLLEGEACTNNTFCASNICNNNKCEGIKDLGVCKINEQCSVGSYCGKLTKEALVTNCIPQKKAGETCDSDYACINDHGCYSKNQTCVHYRSLDDGAEVGTVGLGKYLCKSLKESNGYCVSTVLTQQTDECVVNNGTVQEVCVYNVTGLPDTLGKTLNSTCQCSRRYPDRKFCQLDTKSQAWQNYVDAVEEHFHHDGGKVHTVRRFSFNLNVRRLYLTTEQYPQFKDADECAIGIELSNYYIKTSLFFIFGLLFILIA